MLVSIFSHCPEILCEREEILCFPFDTCCRPLLLASSSSSSSSLYYTIFNVWSLQHNCTIPESEREREEGRERRVGERKLKSAKYAWNVLSPPSLSLSSPACNTLFIIIIYLVFIHIHREPPPLLPLFYPSPRSLLDLNFSVHIPLCVYFCFYLSLSWVLCCKTFIFSDEGWLKVARLCGPLLSCTFLSKISLFWTSFSIFWCHSACTKL